MSWARKRQALSEMDRSEFGGAYRLIDPSVLNDKSSRTEPNRRFEDRREGTVAFGLSSRSIGFSPDGRLPVLVAFVSLFQWWQDVFSHKRQL